MSNAAVIDSYMFATDAEIIQSFISGKFCKISIVAEGEWSAVDMEMLYEIIGHGLRDGIYDTMIPKNTGHQATRGGLRDE